MTRVESKLQKVILDDLELRGCIAVNVIVAGLDGVSDIVGCTHEGLFFAIETKREKSSNKPSVLQYSFIEDVKGRKGIAFWCNSMEGYRAALRASGKFLEPRARTPSVVETSF